MCAKPLEHPDVLVDVPLMRPLASPTRPSRRRARRAGHVAPVVAAAPAKVVPTPEERARRAGGPEDRALYTCGCGAAFDAAVLMDVSCPACGAAQSW